MTDRSGVVAKIAIETTIKKGVPKSSRNQG